jgi:DMSO reductase family type II enzyme chaperone
MSGTATPGTASTRTVKDPSGRISRAADRCAGYSFFATLTASPHEQDIDALLADWRNAADCGPDRSRFFSLAQRIMDIAAVDRRRQYSALFEVGDDGPPIPLREDLLRGQEAGIREDIVLFYKHFGYTLDEGHAWAPDHLSVELEFIQYLCLREASGGADALSWQLGQLDFCERHLEKITPLLAARIGAEQSAGVYGDLIQELDTFVSADIGWQRSTIVTRGQS